MNKAIKTVRQSSSILLAAITHRVPCQTLQDRISGRVTHKPYLSQTEEKDLVDFLVEISQVGYGKSRQQIKWFATLVMRDKGLLKVEKKLINGWYYHFMGRQDHLTLQKGDPTANVRMDYLSKKVMKEYFEKPKKTLEENNWINNPSQIYNADEAARHLITAHPK